MKILIQRAMCLLALVAFGCDSAKEDPCGGRCEAGEVCTVDGQCIRLVAEPREDAGAVDMMAPTPDAAAPDAAVTPDAEVVVDTDEDGVPDATDNCPEVANPDQADEDSDGHGDVCQNDWDSDGFEGEADPCPGHPTTSADDTPCQLKLSPMTF